MQEKDIFSPTVLLTIRRSILASILSPRNTGSLAENIIGTALPARCCTIRSNVLLLLPFCYYFSEQNFTSSPLSIIFVVRTAHILPHIEQV